MSPTSLGAAAGKASSERSSRVFRIENHDEALPIWREFGGKDRILVHVDAHHDIWWVPSEEQVTIANFIAPALRDGLLREIYWVVPDRSWDSLENRWQIIHHLHRIQKNFPGRPKYLEVKKKRIDSTLLGKPFHICSAEGLPEFSENVLLDLDVDYLIFSRVCYGPGDPHPALPWCWPEDLVARIHASGVQSDLVTIAYSVEGGFTPLRWKYLGDELETRLDTSAPVAVQGMNLMREGAEAAARGESTLAKKRYLEAAECLPSLAAPFWHLAFLYLDCGRVAEGQKMYQRALDLDPSYRTVFNSVGIWDYWNRFLDVAEQEYRRTLALDPDDAYAHLGLGWIFLERSNWSEAESELRRAIEIRPALLDAHRGLGTAFRKTGQRPQAIASYEKSLKLALLGNIPLRENDVVISGDGQRRHDINHFAVYLRLGRLYNSEGDQERALQYLRMAANGGLEGAGFQFQIAWLAFRRRQWKLAWAEAIMAFKQSVLMSGRAGEKLWRSVRRPFRRTRELWQVR